MRLRDLLDEASVKIGLESTDKEECFEELVDLLVRAGRIEDRTGALQAISERESQATTGIGNGVAIPHGKHHSISKLTAAIGISHRGIEFDAQDGQPVHLVIVLLADVDNPGPHIQALVEVSRLIQLPGFYRRAIAVTTPTEFLDLVDSEE